MKWLAKGYVRITGAFMWEPIVERNHRVALEIAHNWADGNDALLKNLLPLIAWRIYRISPTGARILNREIPVGDPRMFAKKQSEVEDRYNTAILNEYRSHFVLCEVYADEHSNRERDIKDSRKF